MNNKDDFIYVIPSESLIKMYFKTCFVPIFDRFIWFGRVLQENLKKFGKHTFIWKQDISVMNHFISQKRSILSIGSFIKVDQHKMYNPNI